MFNPWSRLSKFGVSRYFFLRNSYKYGLGYFRKILRRARPPVGPGPTSKQLLLILQPTNQRKNTGTLAYKVKALLIKLFMLVSHFAL